jgi:hypothetical protein
MTFGRCPRPDWAAWKGGKTGVRGPRDGSGPATAASLDSSPVRAARDGTVLHGRRYDCASYSRREAQAAYAALWKMTNAPGVRQVSNLITD